MSFSTTRRIALIATAAAMVLPAWATDKLVVAAFPSNPPFEARNPAGEFEGFEVDVVRELGKRIGAAVDIQPFDFQPIFAAVSSGRVDLAISTISVTPERLKSLGFLQPHFDGDAAIAVKKGGGVTSFADLKGKTVGTISATTHEKWLRENQAKFGYEIKLYNGANEVLMDLQAGRIAANLNDFASLAYAIKKMNGLEIGQIIKGEYQFAAMIRKGHPLTNKLNDALGEMKKDGTMNRLHQKHFDTQAQAGSSTITVMPLPQ